MATSISDKVRKRKLELCPFCAVCHSTESLELNHIDPDKPATIDNLIVLCSEHHGIWHEFSTKNRHTDKVKRGIREAQARGVHFGKKPADAEKVIRIIAENSTQFNYDSWMTEREVMDMTGLKLTAYCKYKRVLIDAMRAEKWPYEWQKPNVMKNRPDYKRVVESGRGWT